MFTRIRSHLRDQWIGALALFLLLAGAGAYAAVDPVGGDGDIDACYDKRSGDLDLRKGRKCDRGEKRVSWSQVGPRGETGPQGAPGGTGAPGTALAYARINAGGTVDQSRSKAISAANVTHPSAGIYCFDGLSFQPKNAVATPEVGNRTMNVFGLIDDASGCPGDEDFLIATRDIQGPGDANPGQLSDVAFYVLIN